MRYLLSTLFLLVTSSSLLAQDEDIATRDSLSPAIVQKYLDRRGEVDAAVTESRPNSLDGCRPAGVGREQFACGECETALQDDFNGILADLTGSSRTANGRWDGAFSDIKTMRDNWPNGQPVNVETTLARIRQSFLENTPGPEPKRLNYMIIGESESLQPSSISGGRMNPRIAIKSPNSELWVTFNTDPTSAAYQTLEVMRWNGQEAKYEFTELNFGRRADTPPSNDPNDPHFQVPSASPRSVDGTGNRCVACHKEDSRPNFETYRAWSGIVPSRDDMLEATEQGGREMGMDGRAYLSFMDRVANAPAGDRLAMLDIPVDDMVQMAGRTPAVSTLSRPAQLAAIRARFQEAGYYRIPHSPYRTDFDVASNFDGKTALLAGASQLSFDQLSGQNMCRISDRLMDDPDYDKFRWMAAGIAFCPSASSNPASWMPPAYQDRVRNYFAARPDAMLYDLAQKGQAPTSRAARAMGFPQVMDLIQKDTTENHSRANGFKTERHQRMGEAFLTEVERLTPAQARTEASAFATTFKSDERSDTFHAIGDDGGVNGVPEGHAPHISAFRALLSPLGINVGEWSMMRGSNGEREYNSLAFSDQFALLFQQEALEATKRLAEAEGGANYCATLQQRSLAELGKVSEMDFEDEAQPSVVAMNDQVDANLAAYCNQPLEGDVNVEPMQDLVRVNQALLGPAAKDNFAVCIECHGAESYNSGVEFEGMAQLSPGDKWTDESWEQFNRYMQTAVARNGRPMGLRIVEKLRAQVPMPPNGWTVPGETPAQKETNDRERREILASYVRFTYFLTPGGQGREQLCNAINNGEVRMPRPNPVETTTPTPQAGPR